MNLVVAVAKELFMKLKMTIEPAKTFYNPQSVMPSAFNVTLLVYKDTNIISNMRKYSIKVFLAMRLLLFIKLIRIVGTHW